VHGRVSPAALLHSADRDGSFDCDGRGRDLGRAAWRRRRSGCCHNLSTGDGDRRRSRRAAHSLADAGGSDCAVGAGSGSGGGMRLACCRLPPPPSSLRCSQSFMDTRMGPNFRTPIPAQSLLGFGPSGFVCSTTRPAPFVRDHDWHADALACGGRLIQGLGVVIACARLLFPGAEPRARRMKHRFASTSIATAMLVASPRKRRTRTIVASRLATSTRCLHPPNGPPGSILCGRHGCAGGLTWRLKGTLARCWSFPLGLWPGLVMQRRDGLDSPGPAANRRNDPHAGPAACVSGRIPTAMLCAIAFGLGRDCAAPRTRASRARHQSAVWLRQG